MKFGSDEYWDYMFDHKSGRERFKKLFKRYGVSSMKGLQWKLDAKKLERQAVAEDVIYTICFSDFNRCGFIDNHNAAEYFAELDKVLVGLSKKYGVQPFVEMLEELSL